MKRMNTALISVGFLALSSLSFLLVLGSNHSNNLIPSLQSVPSVLRADGDPAPPFPEPPSLHRADALVFVADGDPAPPFPEPPLRLNSEARESKYLAEGEGGAASV